MKAHDHVRTCHDEWGKRALSLWLQEFGDVELDARIAGESRRGDVLYTERHPEPQPTEPQLSKRRARRAQRERLGMLGELARDRVLFELFRNALTLLELQSCLVKVVELKAREAREARRTKRPLSSATGPTLCVITPSMSSEFAAEAGVTRMAGGKPGCTCLHPCGA